MSVLIYIRGVKKMKKNLSFLSLLVGCIIILFVFMLVQAQDKTRIVLYNPDLTFGNIETFTASISSYLDASSNSNQDPLSLDFFRHNDDLENYIREQNPGFGILNSWYYINNKGRFNAKPMLIASKDDKTYYHKIIVVHKDSDIKQLDDLKGKTLALASSGKQDYPYLDKVIFKGQLNSKASLMIMPVSKDMDALLALVMKQVDAALVTPGSYELLKEASPAYVEGIESFYTSPPIPMPILCTIKPNIQQETINHVQDVFLEMDIDPMGQETLRLLQIDEWIPFSNTYLQGFGYAPSDMYEMPSQCTIFDYLVSTAYAYEEESELPTICILKTEDLARYNIAVNNFQNMLDANYEIFSLEGDIDKAEEIIPLIEELEPDLILALGSKAAISAQEHFNDIPIVFAMVVDYSSLTADNITGITMNVPLENQLSLLKLLVPTINTIGIIYNPKYTKDYVKNLTSAMDKFELQLIVEKVNKSDKVEKAFNKIKDDIDAFWLAPDLTIITKENFSMLVQKTQENNIPFVVLSSAFVRSGGFLSIAPNDESIGNQAAAIAKQIIRGKKPSEISISMPIGTLITVNLITAKNIGLDIPTEKLIFANEIIK